MKTSVRPVDFVVMSFSRVAEFTKNRGGVDGVVQILAGLSSGADPSFDFVVVMWLNGFSDVRKS